MPELPRDGQPAGQPPEPDEAQDLVIVEDELLREGFTQLPNVVLRMRGLSPGAKLVYAALLSYAWQTGSCFPGQSKIAEDLDISERSVRKYIRELKEQGLVQVIRRGFGRTNIYFLPRLPLTDGPPPSPTKPPPLRDNSNPGSIPVVNGKICRSRTENSAALERQNLPLEEYTQQQYSQEEYTEKQQQGQSGIVRPPARYSAELETTENPKKQEASFATFPSPSLQEPGSLSAEALLEKLRKFKVHARVARRLVREFPPERINAILNYVAARLADGWRPHHSVPAWIVSALQRGYDIPSPPSQEPPQPAPPSTTSSSPKSSTSSSPDFSDPAQLWQAAQEQMREKAQWRPIFAVCDLRQTGPNSYELIVPHSALLNVAHNSLPIAAAAIEEITGASVKLTINVAERPPDNI